MDPLIANPRTAARSTRRSWYVDRVVVGEHRVIVRDQVQWGPILAGALVGLVTLLALTLLGLAIGTSAFDPSRKLSDWNTWAGVWGGLSVLVAFFVAGWVAAQTAAVEGAFAGMINGLLAGAAMLAALVILTSVGLTNLVGFLGGNLAAVSRYANAIAQGGTAPADQRAAFTAVRDGAWGTVVTIVVALAVAALAGVAAHHDRGELLEDAAAV